MGLRAWLSQAGGAQRSGSDAPVDRRAARPRIIDEFLTLWVRLPRIPDLKFVKFVAAALL
jgi:hypothetical protein